MEPVMLILTALAAGASAGALDALTDETKGAVKTARGKLRDLIDKRFRQSGTPNGAVVLAKYEADPDTFEKGLGKKLAEASAGNDVELMAVANALLELLSQQSDRSGKYDVTVSGSQGIQIGDHGTQTNTFTSPPPRS